MALPLKTVFSFLIAVTAAAYITALLRIVLGLALGTDHPYMGPWNDILQFPLLFAAITWPATALVFLASIFIAGRWGRVRAQRGVWTILCGSCFAALAVGIVAVRSISPWEPSPVSLFDVYAQTWSDGHAPLFKLILPLSFGVGGLVGAAVFELMTRKLSRSAT